MSDAAAVLGSVAAGIIANFISFYALQRFSRPPDPTAIRVERQSVTIERTHIRGPLTYELFERKIVITETTFTLKSQSRTGLNLAISIGVAIFSVVILLWVLLF